MPRTRRHRSPRQHRVRTWTLALLASAGLALTACRAAEDPMGGGTLPLSGDWVALCGVDVACVLHLRQTDGTITGTFAYQSVIGPSPTLPLTGRYTAPTAHLTWQRDGQAESLDGTLQDDTVIVGTIHEPTTSFPVTFRRR